MYKEKRIHCASHKSHQNQMHDQILPKIRKMKIMNPYEGISTRRTERGSKNSAQIGKCEDGQNPSMLLFITSQSTGTNERPRKRIQSTCRSWVCRSQQRHRALKISLRNSMAPCLSPEGGANSILYAVHTQKLTLCCHIICICPFCFPCNITGCINNFPSLRLRLGLYAFSTSMGGWFSNWIRATEQKFLLKGPKSYTVYL